MEEIKYRKEDEMKLIEDSWMDSIPKEWNVKKLSYLSSIVTGNTPSKKTDMYYKNGNIPWIKPDNIKDDYSISDTKEKLNKSGSKVARIIPPNSAVVCCIGTVGKVGINRIKSTTNQQINSIIFDKKYIWVNKYGLYCMISSRSEHEKYSSKVVVSILNKTQQGNIKMPCPNINEQQKIANFLDIKTSQFNSIISKKEKLIEKLEEAKKSLISEVVTGKVKIVDGEMVERKSEEMKDSGIEWLGEIPKDWEVTKIKNLLKVYSGKEISQGKSQEEDIIDVYGSGGVFKKTNKFLYKGEAILFGRKGTIGKPIYVNKKFWTVDTMYYAITKDNAFTKFIYYQLIIYNWGLITTSTALPSIVGSDLENEYTVVPSLKEQNNIIKSLSINLLNINHIINKTKTQIQKLKEAKQSLISEAVTGKIDLRDWEIREEDIV